MDVVQRILETMTLNPPVSEDSLEKVQQILGIVFPKEYAEIMRQTNGIEGSIGKHGYLVLYPIEDLPELNRGYGFDEFVPGLMLFGSDGGGEGYAFDKRNSTYSVVEMPFVDLEFDVAIKRGDDFKEFLQYLLAN